MILQSQPSDAPSWMLIASPTCVLALPAAAATAFDEARLAAALASIDGFRTTLELLVAGGIAGAPSFALVDGDATVARVVLRGETSVTVTSIDPEIAELTIGGTGMATWSERVLEGARSLHLRVPGSTWTLHLGPAVVAPVTAPSTTPPAPVVRPEAAAVAEATLVPSSQIEVPVAVVAGTDADASEGYDFLFGDTIYRTRAGASIRIPNPDPERPGDHDGRTMLAADLGLHEPPPAVSEATVIAPIPGHVRAPAVPALPQAPPTDPPTDPAPRMPATLQLERADGGRESLGIPVLIGRAPSVSGSALASGPRPRLITIPDDKDISRSHVRVAVEGDAVVVTDLASKNGTVVTLPGASPRKLRSGEPTVVLPGTLIDLGGGVRFIVRED